MDIIKKIWGLFCINIKVVTRYPAAIWANVFVNILQVVILYYIWMAVYGENVSIFGVNKLQMITYIVLSRLIYINGIVSWGINQWMTDIIKDGQISIELLRPIDFQLLAYARRIGVLIFSMLIYGTPAIIIFLLFINIFFPLNIITLVLFFISFMLAMTINFFIEFMIGLFGFYTNNGWGLQILKEGLFSFFSGALIPVIFMPKWIQSIVNMLPFKDIIYTPLSIYIELYNEKQSINLILNQIIWVIILFCFSRILYRLLLRKITVQGG